MTTILEQLGKLKNDSDENYQARKAIQEAFELGRKQRTTEIEIEIINDAGLHYLPREDGKAHLYIEYDGAMKIIKDI